MTTKPTAIGLLSLYVAVAVGAVAVGAWHLPDTANAHWYWGIAAKTLAVIAYAIHRSYGRAD